jgi:hypothetical protein
MKCCEYTGSNAIKLFLARFGGAQVEALSQKGANILAPNICRQILGAKIDTLKLRF